MRSTPKVRAILSALLLVASARAFAYAPLVVLGAGADAAAGNSVTGVSSRFLVRAAADYRTAIGANAYCGLWADAEVSLVPTGGSEFADEVELGLTAGTLPGAVELSATARLTAVTGLLDAAAALGPSWEAVVLVPVADGPFSLGAAASAAYLWTADDDTDHLEHRLALRALAEPGFARGYRIDLAAAVDRYPQTFLLDATGAPSAAPRTDFLASSDLQIDLLTGYFSRLQITARGGARLSDANRLVGSVVEERSEDRLFAASGASLALDPTSRVGIDLSLTADGAYYLSRAAISDTGAPLDRSLAYLRGTAAARIAWSPVSRLFLLADVNGAAALANDREYAGWSAGAALAVEVRL